MNKILIGIIITLGLVIICPKLLYAGAWAQPRGHYYSKFTFIYAQANSVFGVNAPTEFTDYALYFYGEYGLFKRSTVILNAPFFKNSQNEANFIRGNSSGYLAGDIEIQAKYQFLDSPVVASVLAGVKLPVAYDVADIPPLGNGKSDFDAKLLLGTSFYPIPIYLTGDVGYRLRGGEFVDEIHFGFEAGYTLWESLLTRFLATGIRSSGTATGESNLFGFPLTQEKMRLGGGLIWILNPRLEIDITYLKTTSGENIPKSNEIFVGIAFKK